MSGFITGCGTHRGYQNGCRCDACRKALNAYRTELRRARGIGPKIPPEHGTASMYTNRACRCTRCVKAQAAAVRTYRANRGTA